MKKIVSIILLLALTLALLPAALAGDVSLSTHALEIDGKPVKAAAYNVDGYNYFRLRDLAVLLKDTDSRFAVEWDPTRGVLLTPGGEYVPNGSELKTGEALTAQAEPSRDPLYVNGRQVSVQAYKVAGSNYYKLADLSGWLGFSLAFDDATRTVRLSTVPEGLSFAANYGEIAEALAASRGGMRGGDTFVTEEAAEAEPEAAEAPMPVPNENGAASSASGSAADSAGGKGADEGYSGTNVQVKGIDEGDIVKTDGKYIYVLDEEMYLTVLSAAGADSDIISRTKIGFNDWQNNGEGEYYDYSSTNKYTREMYVSDGIVAVISNYNYYHDYQTAEGWDYENESYTCLDVLDLTDPLDPEVLNSMGQDGWFVSSRLLDGRIYLVTNYWVYSFDEEEPVTFIPSIYRNGVAEPIAAGDICIAREGNEFVVAAAYDLNDGSLLKAQSLLGAGDQVYMSADSLYVFGSVWGNEAENTYTESVYTVTEYRNSTDTMIHRFALTEEGLDLAAQGKVPGYLDSQFSADEKDGMLRIVTTTSEYTYKLYVDEAYGFSNYVWGDDNDATGLYILDSRLNVLGSVEDLAPGERVYSARFDGDIAYFCTFRQVDPLFAVDLSDPTNPTVLSALKIPGFSEYLHSWGEGRLFGFGRDADEETGRTGNLKLVMFDTTDKADVKVENTLLLDASYSEALYNHKAFFISPEKNLIGFVGDGDYYIFSYDPAEGFKELSHFEFDWYNYDMRGFWIGECVYLASPSQALVLDMNGWAPLKQITIVDYEDPVVYEEAKG